MAAAYSETVHVALQRKLSEVLLDSKVPEAQVKWLIEKGITTVAAFNNIADGRSQVEDKVMRWRLLQTSLGRPLALAGVPRVRDLQGLGDRPGEKASAARHHPSRP